MDRIEIIAAELTNDPKTVGYAGMGHEAAAAALNQVGLTSETRDRDIIQTWEIAVSVTVVDWTALTPIQRDHLRMIVSAGYVSVKNALLRTTLLGMFSAQSATRPNLIALLTESISRAEALGLGSVQYFEVAQARGE